MAEVGRVNKQKHADRGDSTQSPLEREAEAAEAGMQGDAGLTPLGVTQAERLRDRLAATGEIRADVLIATRVDRLSRSTLDFAALVDRSRREGWSEIIPESEAVLKNVVIVHAKLVGLYEKNATSLLKIFRPDGHLLSDAKLPGMGSITSLPLMSTPCSERSASVAISCAFARS